MVIADTHTCITHCMRCPFAGVFQRKSCRVHLMQCVLYCVMCTCVYVHAECFQQLVHIHAQMLYAWCTHKHTHTRNVPTCVHLPAEFLQDFVQCLQDLMLEVGCLHTHRYTTSELRVCVHVCMFICIIL